MKLKLTVINLRARSLQQIYKITRRINLNAVVIIEINNRRYETSQLWNSLKLPLFIVTTKILVNNTKGENRKITDQIDSRNF